MKHVTLGTAGHVDHGKTSLVKALTGRDTDRFAEEKRRGITIDLGFAPLSLGPDLLLSVVDVPGHEDFVRNMVAGATGVDVALLTIAADEGIMPQTQEHLAILEFLGVSVGCVALTKVDLVDEEWLALVQDDVANTLATSPIAWDTIVPTSVTRGTGITDLKEALRRLSLSVPSRDVGEWFRMPVDRSFSVPGAGTVVTGTVWSGRVQVGQDVTVFPEGSSHRVRGVEVHGEAASEALPGRRTALAMVGLERHAVGRGSDIVAGEGWAETDRVDVEISLMDHAKPLTQRSRVRVHIGTAEVMARMTPADATIAPGHQGTARLRLDTPVTARFGDRLVIRAYSPVTTIAGATVLDPFPPPRPRRPRPFEPGFRDKSLVERIARLVPDREPRVRTRDLPIRFGGASPGEAELADAGLVQVADWIYPRSTVEEARRIVEDAIDLYHDRYPMRPGWPIEDFRRTVGDADVADYLGERVLGAVEITMSEGKVKRKGFVPFIPVELRSAATAMEEMTKSAGAVGATREALLGDGTDMSRDVLEYLERDGTVVQLSGPRYYHRSEMERLVDTIVQHLSAQELATPAEIRDLLGVSRKYVIPIMEWCDAEGITSRDGDARRLGPTAHQV